MRWLLLICLLTITGCPHRSEVRRLASVNSPPVVVGHYPDYIEILYGNRRFESLISRLRSDAEANEQILRNIVRRHIELKSPLEFSFKYAAIDTSAGVLLLRYFAPHPEPILIAGWQAQLVYRLPSGRLEKVYVEEVPLE